MVAQGQGESARGDWFGVPLVRWPADRSQAEDLESRNLPFLLLVAADAPPPQSGYRLMDWVRSPVDPDELVVRRENLEARYLQSWAGPRPHLDDDTGRLTFGRAATDVGMSRVCALRGFVDAYREIVSMAQVRALFGLGSDEPDVLLKSRVVKLRAAVRAVGLDIKRVRGVGFSLEPMSLPQNET